MRFAPVLLMLILAAPRLIPAAGRPAPDTASSPENLYIATEYSVEIDYPNFVISILAHLTGVHFSRLTLDEWHNTSAVPEKFLYHLTEGEDRWLELSSDSTFASFLKLPRSDRVSVSPGALRFAKALVRFFRAPSSDTVRAVFEYGGDTLGARAFQLVSRVDSGSKVTTVTRVETWNRDSGEGYIHGIVRAVTRGGYTIYDDILVDLIDKNIKMHFTPTHSAIARGVALGETNGASAQNALHRPD